MPAIALRGDYTAEPVRGIAARAKDADQARRLLSIAAVYDGMSRADAARIGGMDRQTLCDWVHRFNDTGPDGLVNRKAPGATPKLTAEQVAELSRIVAAGPDPERDGVVRWRCLDLKGLIRERYGVDYHERSVGKLLAALGFAHVSARPRHRGQDPEALETFKKDFPNRLAEIIAALPAHTPIEIWFQDEMRVGQKNALVRQWAARGSRPRQVRDRRTASAYLFGAICPERGEGAALVLPRADTEGMALHLAEIGRAVAPGAHAILRADQAGWHTTNRLVTPANISLIPLPARSPELCTKWTRSGNPVENVWQYLRQTWLSNRVFPDYEAILDACCRAWNNLMDRPWKIMSTGLRQWARTGQH